jgi:hypothetical protein
VKLARRNLVLAAALAALVVVDLATRVDTTLDREIGPLVADFHPDRVASIEVAPPTSGGPLAPLVVERAAADAPWTLPAKLGYPALPERVDPILAQVAGLSTLDLVAESAADHGRYGVDAAGVLLTLRDATGGIVTQLVQGATAPDGRATYVRLAERDEVYRMPGTRPWPTTVEPVLDPFLIRIAASGDVAGFRVSGGAFDGVFHAVRDHTQAVQKWSTVDGHALQSGAVDRELGRLNRTFLVDVLAAEPLAEDAPTTLRFELDRVDGTTRVLRCGEPLPDGTIPATLDDAPWTVAIDPVAFQALVGGLVKLIGG